MQNGILPDNMKTSRTIPVFKKSGSPLEMNNYRPIAIINAFSKIFEKIISKRLVTFWTQNKPCCNITTSALNEGKYSILILLHVQKAFDSVKHSILLYKLENAGIRGVVLDWFKSYLSNRKQKVQVGSKISENTSNLNIGVIQGSILGVILFLISIKDISIL